MFLDTIDDFFRFDSYGYELPRLTHMNPMFEEQTIGHRGNVTIMRGRDGIVAERYLNDVDCDGNPHDIVVNDIDAIESEEAENMLVTIEPQLIERKSVRRL